MLKKIAFIALVLLFLLDIGFSFLQFYHQSLDGDMAGGIIPSQDVKTVLSSPLGLDAIIHHKYYPNPNKYFCHKFFSEFFNEVPIILQQIFSPINSIYIATALIKTVFHVVLIALIALLIRVKNSFSSKDFALAAIIIAPLFQTNGYREMMIVLSSVTYSFFYTLPSILIILFFLPVFLHLLYKKQIHNNIIIKAIWVLFALITSLSGPLNPGIALIITLLILLYYIRAALQKNHGCAFSGYYSSLLNQIPKGYLFYLIPISLFSIYSLYLGNYNSINQGGNQPSLAELYARIPAGIYYQFTQKLGFPLLFIAIAFNYYLLQKKSENHVFSGFTSRLRWIAMFAVLYILLLPLGGYREYRPNILRFDTMIPITMALIYLYGFSTFLLVKTLTNKFKTGYILLITVISFVYTIADKPEFNNNTCERNALIKISKSQKSIVELDDDCTVLSWRKSGNPADSELNSQLLFKWRITNRRIHYYWNLR